MNFIFISPQFPDNYYLFCQELKNNGVNVLGIGDTPYDQLTYKQRDSLNEYYKVNDMSNYDEMMKAVAYFIFKYGRIDYIESNNEYWLIQDARLRTDFNIRSGLFDKNVKSIKYKSEMKKFYTKAGIKTARWILVKDLEGCKKFISEVKYPVIAKPDNGVGAAKTYKISNLKELKAFLKEKDDETFIMEEYINGDLVSYDGIAGKNREIIYETEHIYPEAVMDLVHNQDDVCFYSAKTINPELQRIGRRAMSVFPSNARCFHTEYFVLKEDKIGLGQKGDYIGLEVNMRPPGGCIPDMMNYANDLSYYKIYADMICGNSEKLLFDENKYCVAFAGRRKQFKYQHNAEEIGNKYHDNINEFRKLPPVLAEAMGDETVLARFDNIEDAKTFCNYVSERTK